MSSTRGSGVNRIIKGKVTLSKTKGKALSKQLAEAFDAAAPKKRKK